MSYNEKFFLLKPLSLQSHRIDFAMRFSGTTCQRCLVLSSHSKRLRKNKQTRVIPRLGAIQTFARPVKQFFVFAKETSSRSVSQIRQASRMPEDNQTTYFKTHPKKSRDKIRKRHRCREEKIHREKESSREHPERDNVRSEDRAVRSGTKRDESKQLGQAPENEIGRLQ